MAKVSKKNDETQKRTVFAINPPTDTESKFLLLVSRGSSMFGGGGSAAFAVDGVHAQTDPSNKAYAVRGFRDRGPGNANATVVEFPLGTSYILVERASIRFMTPVEMTKEQAEEDIALAAVEKEYSGKLPSLGKLEETLIHPTGKPVGNYS